MANKMLACHFCDSEDIKELLDLGKQPVSNHFLLAKGQSENTYPMVINQCQDCGLVQINNPVCVDKLRPPHDWITYSEPEGHLDSLVEIIKALPGITPESRFCGISFKDDSTLGRLQNLGFSKTHRLNLKDDLNIDAKGAGAETIQAHLTPQRGLKIAQDRGKFDVVIVRHILEHVHDVAGFIKALKNLTEKTGYIVFEVPDCSRALGKYDYTTLWEEHTLYFTPATFQNSLNFAGFTSARYECYPYPFENSLVAIVKATESVKLSQPSKEIVREELVRAISFARHLPKRARIVQEFLKEYRKDQGKIALFGAGHLACTFVNLLGLKDFIDFFVDDNPHKCGLFMPGCQLPIYDSGALRREKVKLCLLSLNPLSEQKVLQAHPDREETFLSIFPSSSLALHIPELVEEDNTTKFNKEVLYTNEALLKVSSADIAVLKEKALANDRKRIRLCCHRDVNDSLHEMLIIHTKDAYVRPHKHLNKSESLHILEGSADVVLFDEQGNITEVIPVGGHSSGRQFYYRMATPKYHTLLIHSDFLVFHETTKGPFQKSDTVLAPWAPEENNIEACRNYKRDLLKRIEV